METEEAQEMAQMPGKSSPTSWLKCSAHSRDNRPTKATLHQREVIYLLLRVVSRGCVVSDGCLLVCVFPPPSQAGRAPLSTKRLRRQRSPWPSPKTCQPVPPTSRTTGGTKVRLLPQPSQIWSEKIKNHLTCRQSEKCTHPWVNWKSIRTPCLTFNMASAEKLKNLLILSKLYEPGTKTEKMLLLLGHKIEKLEKKNHI